MLGGMSSAYIYAGERTKRYYTGIKESISSKPSRVIQAPVKMDSTITSRSHVLDPSVLRLLLVGYVNNHKGIDLLIEALSVFDSEIIKCDIIGPVLKTQEGYKKKLDELSAKCGVELNYLGFKRITNEVFSNYDFYICSSRREASPMAVWEALSFGIPVLSTPVGDVKEIIEKHKAGLVAKEITAESMSDIIQIACEIKQKTYNEWSNNSFKAATLFDHTKIAKEYYEFYTEVIDE